MIFHEFVIILKMNNLPFYFYFIPIPSEVLQAGILSANLVSHHLRQIMPL
jgi:hypothetical protein